MKFTLTAMTKEEILDIIQDCQAELVSRQKEEKMKLIKNFKNAFFALKDARTTIWYTDEKQEVFELLLDDFDNFEFD